MNNFRLLAVSCAVAFILTGCGNKPEDLVQLPADKPSALLIKNVAVFNVESGQVIPGRDVVVSGDRITAITQSGKAGVPDGALTIDGTGATLLPGLIDMHSHVGFSSAPRWAGELPNPPRNLQAYLYAGITTVFDTGGMDNKVFKLRERVASGELPGPRIYATGPLVTTEGGHPVAIMERFVPWWIKWYIIPHQTRQAGTPDEAREVIRDVASYGPDAIKLAVDRIPHDAPRMQRDMLEAAVDETHRLGLRAVAHIGFVEDAVNTGEAGVDLWVHGVYQERIPDKQIRKIASFGIPMVPTTVVFESYALLGRGPRIPTELEHETASKDILEAFNNVPDSEDNTYFRPFLEHLHKQRSHWRENVRRLHKAGVTIMAGSDMQAGVFPGAGLHRELYLLKESGLSSIEVIQAATINGARFLTKSEDPEFGIVAEGKIADLLLVDGDPTTNFDSISLIRAVIKNGVLLERHPYRNAN